MVQIGLINGQKIGVNYGLKRARLSNKTNKDHIMGPINGQKGRPHELNIGH